MVVDDFDSIRAGSRPDEADAELVVDADAVLACAITSQGIQPVARGNMQVVQTDRDLQLFELASSHALKELEPGQGPAVGQSLGDSRIKLYFIEDGLSLASYRGEVFHGTGQAS